MLEMVFFADYIAISGFVKQKIGELARREIWLWFVRKKLPDVSQSKGRIRVKQRGVRP
jgi:hypothetical protein